MSTVVVGTIQSNSTSPPTFNNTNGTQIGTLCRAFVNFNGTGTVAIRASFNVTSVADNGTGDYTVNFTNAMPDANYSVCGTAALQATGSATPRFVAPVSQAGLATSNVQIRTADDAGVTVDTACVSIAIFR
jgi:hypothetical protein